MLVAVPGSAQTAPSAAPAAPSSVALPEVVVIGSTPISGSDIDPDKLPANLQTLTGADLRRAGSASILNGLGDRAGSVTTNSVLGDPFQPDLLYRGFNASPVLGTPQGLAIYQNGVRINEAFGDTVNWDLIPDIAIERLDVVSNDPAFGLNALGGAIALRMKSGFTFQGFEGELAGGSFGQRSASIQYGKRVGAFGGYIAARGYDQDGWRQFSPDQLKQLYASFGAHGERAAIDLDFTGANNRLFGQGVTPVQELAAGRSLVFTTPQSNFNQLQFATLNATLAATDSWTFQATAYRREFHQTVANGNTTEFTPCAPANGFLCQSDATTLVTQANGDPIPDLSNGGAAPIGQNDRETIRAVSLGGALQASYAGAIFDRPNNFVAGATLDHAGIDFQSSAEIGIINPLLQVTPSGFFADTPENSGFNAIPTLLKARDDYYGLFFSDTFEPIEGLAITASGRYNWARVAVSDRRGANLSGTNFYRRFNPALGATYKIAAALTAYAGYSEGNRAPTPSEIECSDPAQPCLLPSSLSSDPPRLKQVVSRTVEAGLRGKFALPSLLPGRFAWNAGLFRTDLSDDIYAVANSISTGFFENIGRTRRQGIEAGLSYQSETWSGFLTYSFVDARFRSAFILPSPSNPFADADGNIAVRPGNRLPGIPLHQLKLGADYHLTADWTIGATLLYFGDQYLRGDESNQNPTLPGYALVNLHSTYRITPNFEIFATVTNLFDRRYASFGQFGDPTGIGAPGVPAGTTTNAPGVDNRFLSPAPPFAAYGGVRVKF